jgi:hypothetical protein
MESSVETWLANVSAGAGKTFCKLGLYSVAEV